jgi:hypothetical protein
VRDVARCLRQDCATAEAATLLLEAGIPAILLKGATFARWLYADDEHRPYVDSDLLVPRSRFRAAGRVLRRAGYRPVQLVLSWRHEHAATWARARDGAVVDLHHMLGLMDFSVDPWPVLVHHTEDTVVAGTRIVGLSEPARCMHVALHAAQAAKPKSCEDLRRAVAAASPETWEQAAALARRLRCEGEFAGGLAVVPAGADLARRLGVAGRRSSMIRMLRSEGAERTYARVASQRTLRGRVAVMVEGMLPGRRLLRARYPWASGPLLGAAFVIDDARKVARLVQGARTRPGRPSR